MILGEINDIMGNILNIYTNGESMKLFDDLMENSNRKKYKEAYDRAEEVLIGLKDLPEYRIPYEIRNMKPERIYMNNEKAYAYLTSSMTMTIFMHKEIQDIGNYYYDKICFLSDCINSTIAKKRIYERLNLPAKFAESSEFLTSIYETINGYYDEMVKQYKICESGAYGEYKVNEKLKNYAKTHGGIILENIRLEVGIDKESAETDTLYITDKAIYSIETKYFGDYGVFVDSQNNWYKNKDGTWKPMDKSPSKQAAFHVRNLRDFFTEMGTSFGRLPIIPVVVMANPKTSIKNEGSVWVYSIDHLNQLLFNKHPSIIDVSTQLQIQKLITGSTLEGKPYPFFDYYTYMQEINNKIKKWFLYFDGIFEIVLKLLEQSDYTTYVYANRWKVTKEEKQILGRNLYCEWYNTYYQKLRLRKERKNYDENFGQQYFEMAIQRK